MSLLFTATCGLLLLLFALVIYFAAANDREATFFDYIKTEAVTKAELLLSGNIDPEILQTIYRQNREHLSEVEIAIYDPDFNLLYHDAIDIDIVQETEEMIDEILELGSIEFRQNGWQVIGVHYRHNEQDYVVTGAGFDRMGYEKLTLLRNTLIKASVLGLILVYFLGLVFSREVLSPLRNIANSVSEITATNLNLRLRPRDSGDELTDLTLHFNEMLDRLEQSFQSQREFVHNISHEIKTPLTAIITEIELALFEAEEGDSRKETLEVILKDARKMDRIVQNLLNMAKSHYDPSQLSKKEIRVDEVLMDARTEALRGRESAEISLHVDEDIPDDTALIVNGNAYLLQVAFINLMDNAVKFSTDKKCAVSLGAEGESIKIIFADRGPGITPEDSSRIFEPFYRTGASANLEGSGIGLSIVKKIIELHGGSISLISGEQKGSSFTVSLERAEHGEKQ